MPVLTPSFLPPSATGAVSPSPSVSSSVASSRSASTMSEVSTAPTSPERGKHEILPSHLQASALKHERILSIPAVTLNMPTISDDMAASLSVALLGHILFLKSQVPFPVVQLVRMPGANSSSKSRAAKKRTDMINAFDELSSHLHTTFSALATALARNKARYPELHSETTVVESASSEVPKATAYLAFVLGPTVGAPKARVILALEGLEVRLWGAREDCGDVKAVEKEEENKDEDVEEESDEDTDSEDESESECDDSDAEEHENEEDDAELPPDSPPASEPSTSRSPSPHEKSLTSPIPTPPQLRKTLSPKSSPTNSPTQPRLAPPRARTHAEEQHVLRAAERLLSRTLANAHADGGGMACELAPTQTHILIRAPRRFSHPAWLPRQNVTSSLETVLADFVRDSGLRGPSETDVPHRKRGVRTEGLLVGCTGYVPDEDNAPGADEGDEMIWWGWDGKLSGFMEW